MIFKSFTNKNPNIITKRDFQLLLGELNNLSIYPWTPKHVLTLTNRADIEFAARAPEVVEKLCKLAINLFEEAENLRYSIDILKEEEKNKIKKEEKLC